MAGETTNDDGKKAVADRPSKEDQAAEQERKRAEQQELMAQRLRLGPIRPE